MSVDPATTGFVPERPVHDEADPSRRDPPTGDSVDRLAGELSESDRTMVSKLSKEVVQRRLTAPALFLIESSKPLNFVFSQMMIVFAPLAGLVVPVISYHRLRQLMENRAFLELLLRAIEAEEDRFMSELRAKKKKASASRRDGHRNARGKP